MGVSIEADHLSKVSIAQIPIRANQISAQIPVRYIVNPACIPCLISISQIDSFFTHELNNIAGYDSDCITYQIYI